METRVFNNGDKSYGGRTLQPYARLVEDARVHLGRRRAMKSVLHALEKLCMNDRSGQVYSEARAARGGSPPVDYALVGTALADEFARYLRDQMDSLGGGQAPREE